MSELISKDAALDCFRDWIDQYGNEHTADEDATYQRIAELRGVEGCDDAISRKTALEALADYIHMIDKTMGKGTLTDDDCMEAAKSVLGEDELPAVQPEIIRCKDCDWWTKQEDSVQGRCELMQMYPTGGWYCGNARRRGGDPR